MTKQSKTNRMKDIKDYLRGEEWPRSIKDVIHLYFDRIEKKKNREILEREIFEALKTKYGNDQNVQIMDKKKYDAYWEQQAKEYYEAEERSYYESQLKNNFIYRVLCLLIIFLTKCVKTLDSKRERIYQKNKNYGRKTKRAND